MKLIAIPILAILLSSCGTTVPSGTAFTVTSGKNIVAVDMGGKTWKDALKQIGVSLMQTGGKALADYITTKSDERLRISSQK